jgi:hypothetical protein
MAVRIGDSTRTALVSLALADVGIGLLLIGTVGLGDIGSILRDIVGWAMIIQAVPNALQAWFGALHRAGEEMLLVNVGFMAFAAYQILATNNAPQTVATIGDAVLIISAGVATAVLWSRLARKRTGHRPRRKVKATAQSEERP